MNLELKVLNHKLVKLEQGNQKTAQCQAMYRNSKMILQKKLSMIHSVKCEYLMILKDKSDDIPDFSWCQKIHKKNKTNNH